MRHRAAMQRGDLLSTMMAVHHDLESQFFEHQTALLDRDYARAAQALADYRRDLFAHASDEEQLVLPRYKELGGDDTDAPVRLFLGEHDKLRTFVDEFVRRVEDLRRQPDDARLLELFDREATFKNLVLHHDLRERNMLYPHLATRIAAEEQSAILAARGLRGA
jgi:hemerythrin superfamily protein